MVSSGDISVVVITKNEEDKIARCLESLKWAGEIIVVDDYSVDNTVKICGAYTRNVYQNKFINYSRQKSFAFSKAKGKWILSVDSDEIVSQPLADEILRAISASREGVNGYYIPRKTFFLKKAIMHCGWYPDYQLRLFRNNKWKMKDVSVHESVEVEGLTRRLKEPLLHYSYSTIFEYIDRMNKYTSLVACDMARDGRPPAVLKALKTFWKMYVQQAGFKDGMRGFFLSFFSAVYQLMAYTKYWELVEKQELIKDIR